MSNRERINLLNDAEVEELYSRPQFNEVERDYYFSLSETEYQLLNKYAGVKTKIYFILQLGFFKAAKQFYKFSIDDAKEDALYIIMKYFNVSAKDISGKIWKENYRAQILDILKLYNYREWSFNFKLMAIAQLEQLIRLYPKGNDTLRELFVFLENEKITLPSYRTLQDLFTEVFKTERNRLDKIIEIVPQELKQKLEKIIKNDNGLSQLNVIHAGSFIVQCDKRIPMLHKHFSWCLITQAFSRGVISLLSNSI
jgi:hypothetical protein